MVRAEKLDLVLVPLALAALTCYHLWLLYTILRHPTRTVIGVNAIARKRWVAAMMAVGIVHYSCAPQISSIFSSFETEITGFILHLGMPHQNTEKNGVLAIQTLRNNIMASTVLATTAITLVSVISVFIGVESPLSSSSFASPHHRLAYGIKSVTSPSSEPPVRLFSGSRAGEVFTAKYLAVSLCFMLAFVCNVQAIRLYAHASFLLGGLPPGEEGHREEFAAYVARTVNSGSYAWSLGLRAFYVAMALFLWTFGPIPMLFCTVLMCGMLYFLDTTREHAHAHWHAGRNGTV
ncbi:hypothetical protein PR202_gb05172 [Eleusine coracana subsp. coracana]|uniref:Uncharacterized protein n=1 Tax=Eleusine coracana subsp. coracana TaxID=191504 RepID=A0AAV5E4R2_ELECO|nr:hypothetical protein PR202_gb05172 [Eleusine coracana subsp. coracana]